MLSRRRAKLIARLDRRKSREREGHYLVEGLRCAATVLTAETDVRFAVVAEGVEDDAEGARLIAHLQTRGVELDRITEREFAEVAATRSPQGILLVCAQPSPAPEIADAASRLLVLDAVQDPGNVGTLIRVAAGFGLDGVVALDGTADPWSSKAVRASAGYVATLPVLSRDWPSTETLLTGLGLPLLLASESAGDVLGAEPTARWALVVGNEGDGSRPAVRERADGRVGIPLHGAVDSLNVAVAGSILMFALSRSGPPHDAAALSEGEST